MIDVTIAGKKYPVSHPLYTFVSLLHQVQAKSYCIPKWGDFEPLEAVRQLLWYVEASVYSSTPKHQEPYVRELTTYVESQLEFLVNGLKEFKGDYIGSTLQNHEFFELRAMTEQCISACATAYERIKYESSDTSPNMLYALEFCLPGLIVLSRMFFNMGWVYSTNDDGGVVDTARIRLMDEEAVKKLNLE